jgi:hypothetical protein
MGWAQDRRGARRLKLRGQALSQSVGPGRHLRKHAKINLTVGK